MKGLRGKRAIVERFAEEGTEVIVFDIRPKAPAHRLVDITGYEAVKRAVAEAGPVDILVNNTKTLARELASKGVRLNTVCPGVTETNMLAEFMHG